jgi:hypothetical protein
MLEVQGSCVSVMLHPQNFDIYVSALHRPYSLVGLVGTP